MPLPQLHLRGPVGNNLRNDAEDIHDLALSLERAIGRSISDAAKLGIWDQATRDSVIDLQRRHALNVDGGLLPGGQTEQLINKLLANKSDPTGLRGSTTFQDRYSPSDHRRETHRANNSLTPARSVADLKVPADTLVRPPDSPLPGVTDAAVSGPQRSLFDSTRGRQEFNRSGIVPVADKTGSKQPAKRRKLSTLSSWVLTQPPFGLSPSAVQTAKRIYNWSNEPVLGLADLKRKTLSNIDAAIAGIENEGSHGLIARVSNAIAGSRLRQARAYTDAFIPTTKGELALLGISVVGTIAAAGKTMMVLRRGQKVFLADPKATKLLPAPNPPKGTVKTHLHHVFPQKYESFFKKRGILIHLSTVRLPANKHLKWVHGGKDRWSTDWKKWIDENPNASNNELYRFAGEMLHKYDIDNITLEVYWRKHGKRLSREHGHEPPE